MAGGHCPCPAPPCGRTIASGEQTHSLHGAAVDRSIALQPGLLALGPSRRDILTGKTHEDLLSNGLQRIDLRDLPHAIETDPLPFTMHLLPFSPVGFVPRPEAGSLMMNEYPSLIPQGL